MKNQILYFCLLLLGSVLTLPAQEDFPPLHQQWIKDFNAGTYAEQHWEKASLFLQGEAYSGESAIHEQLLALQKEIQEIQTYQSEKLISHRQSNYFEMGYYQADNRKYASIIAWKKAEGVWTRELQILYEVQQDAKTPSEEEVNGFSKAWMKYSNAHNPTQLLEKVYSPDAIYVNGGRVEQGRQGITKRYAYMSNPKWQIKLIPLHQVHVQENIIYEIGRYESGGIGHYVIVWEKQANGIWQACLDFNF